MGWDEMKENVLRERAAEMRGKNGNESAHAWHRDGSSRAAVPSVHKRASELSRRAPRIGKKLNIM